MRAACDESYFHNLVDQVFRRGQYFKIAAERKFFGLFFAQNFRRTLVFFHPMSHAP